MIVKLAMRNLTRHRWRSLMTAGGVAVAVGMLIWTVCFTHTFSVAMIQGATAVDVGQVQIHSEAYIEKPSLYHAFPVASADLDRVRALPAVAGASPRVHAFGLVGHEARSQVARVIGVDAVHEVEVTRLAKGVTKGRWLSPAPSPDGPREALLGDTLARTLSVSPGDELVLFLQAADGSLGNDLLKVVGIIRSGNEGIDRAAVIMHLADAQFTAALEGEAHEVTIALHRFDDADDAAVDIQRILDAVPAAPAAASAPAGASAAPAAAPASPLKARTWRAVLPQLAQMIQTSEKSIWVIYVIIYLLASLGILNTQRMSAMERRREFGVLLAIGLKPRQLALTLITESTLLTAAGGAAGALLGWALSTYHAIHGLNLTSLTDSGASFSYMNVSFSDTFYFTVNAASVLQPFALICLIGTLCGLWPALASARLNPIHAIAGRQG
jgi:ABC-type lipoprotein release transport system permease subunit